MINVSFQAKEGEGLPRATQALGQAVSFLAGEAVTALIPRFRQLPLEQKVAINVAVATVPTLICTVAATVIAHKFQMQGHRNR